ncbi:MAG: 3-deoxy-8-phosphooctulonate synthase, partial [Myxococcales bacterium]|nr:3-deoxy-8-phosphooctulonate synthase [Myxococcales bacterium]
GGGGGFLGGGARVTSSVTLPLHLGGGWVAGRGGGGPLVESLAVAGVSQGIAGVFLEVHPDPLVAKCDGPCALPLDRVGAVLDRLVAVDGVVKGG